MDRNRRRSGVDEKRILKGRSKKRGKESTKGIKMVRGTGNSFHQQVMILLTV